MFAYVNLRHDKLPTALFRVKRGNRYIIYCRNILGLTACGVSARVAKQRYREVVQRVILICKQVGDHMHRRTMDLYQKMEAGDNIPVEADETLYTIMSLTMAKRLDALAEGLKGLESPLFQPGEKETLLAEMQALLALHTREDFASSQEHVNIRRSKKKMTA